MTALVWLNESWLKKREEFLEITRPTLGDGSANPHYQTLKNQIETAVYHLDTKNKIIEISKTRGFKRNHYDGKCCVTGEEVPAFAGFVKKEHGKWVTYSREEVIAILGIEIKNLPKIPTL